MEQGADVHKEKWNGEAPLFSACKSGNVAIVKYLVELGADVNKEKRNGETPLFNACIKGNKATVKYLVEQLPMSIKKIEMVKHHYLMPVDVEMKPW